MVITIPFGTGVVAAFIFLIFELLVFPVLMYATSTLASFHVLRRATKRERILIRSISYPFWNEGLFHRQPLHKLLFMLRIVCVVIPVYLETRFVSHSNTIHVSKLLPNAYVLSPKAQDENLHNLGSSLHIDAVLVPLEVFSRCATLDDEGWVTAKVANVTIIGTDRQTIQCVPGTDKAFYRSLERYPPFVEPSAVANKYFIDTTPTYRPNLTLQVIREEGPFQEFAPWPGLEENDGEWQYIQVKNVTVLDTQDIECFFWRSPLPDGPPLIFKRLLEIFMCQNVTGTVVDFYYASIEGMANQNSIRILSRNGNMISKQLTVATALKFVGSVEFRDKIMINAGHIIRRLSIRPPITSDRFAGLLRELVYTRASNVTVEVPGDEEAHSVEVDGTVLVVGAVEVIAVLVVGMGLAIVSRSRWRDMQKANTVEGLSHIWAENRARWGSFAKNARITLRLGRRSCNGQERFMYKAVDVESGATYVTDDDRDEAHYG